MKDISLFLFVSLAACSARDGDAAAVQMSPIEKCDERVHCEGDFGPFDMSLERKDGVCRFGAIAMYEDGTSGNEGAWEGTSEHFTLCTAISGTVKCRICNAIHPPNDPPSAPGGSVLDPRDR